MNVLFESDRLVVRRVDAADVEHLLPILGDAEVMRLYGSGQALGRTEIAQMIATYPADDSRLICQPGVILLKPTLETIDFGGVGYYQEEGKRAELLFVLAKAYWERGLATELARGALTEAFHHPEVTTIYATVKPANLASIRVLEKSGMRFDRSLPDVDRLLYRLDRTE